MDVSKGYLQYAILKILEDKVMHGYKITMELEKRIKWKPSPGSMYPVLSSMESEKLIVGMDLVEMGKYKKVYKITDKGLEHLKNFRKQFRDFITFMGFK